MAGPHFPRLKKTFMKLKSIYLTLLTLTLITFSCEDFDELNENPNEPTTVSADVLLTSAIRQSVNTSTNESFLLGNNAAQLTAKTLRTEIDAYNWNAFPTVWDGMYTALTDVNSVEDQALEQGNEQLEGVAIVLRSWIFSVLTNAYGDIPYFDAINGDDGSFTPVYDEQSAIYEDLLSELERASSLLDGGGSISGDILLNNDASRWQKLANSLRLRLLMTAGNALPDAGNRFAAVVNGASIMESNVDNATLTYLPSVPNTFPLLPLKTGDFDAVAFSQTALDVMSQYDDPRLSRYARPDNDDFDNPMFSGAANGSNNANCSKIGSRLGVQYYNDGSQTTAAELGLDIAKGIVMTYAEVEFLLAEAAAKGWIQDDVETHYRAGIAASMVYHQVDPEPFGYSSVDDFYNNSGVAYEEVTDIWEQKWLALYFTGLEPYFEVRRWYAESGMSFDGIPFLSAPCDNLNNDQLPMRFLYPGEERSLNQNNYEAAASRIGGDNFNTTIWLVE